MVEKRAQLNTLRGERSWPPAKLGELRRLKHLQKNDLPADLPSPDVFICCDLSFPLSSLLLTSPAELVAERALGLTRVKRQ